MKQALAGMPEVWSRGTRAASIQQLPELESGEAGTAETPPLIYGPPATGVAEQARRRKQGVQKEDPVILFEVGQGQP